MQPPASTPPPSMPSYPSAMTTLRRSFVWISLVLLLQCTLMWAIGDWFQETVPWTTDANPTTFDGHEDIITRRQRALPIGDTAAVGSGSSTPMEWTRPSLVEHVLMHVFALGFGFMLLLAVDCTGKLLHLTVQGISGIVSVCKSLTWTCFKRICPGYSMRCQQCLHSYEAACYCCLPSNTDEVTSARIFGWRRRARTRTVSVDDIGPLPPGDDDDL